MREPTVLIARLYDKPTADARLLRHIALIIIALRRKCHANTYRIVLLHTGTRNEHLPFIWKSVPIHVPTILGVKRAKLLHKIMEIVVFNITLILTLLIYNPRMIHIVNVDSGLALLWIPIRSKRVIVADFFDSYWLLFLNSNVLHIVKRILHALEYKLLVKANLIVVPSKLHIDIIFEKKFKQKKVIMPNSPLPGYIRKAVEDAKQVCDTLMSDISDNALIYVGSVNRIRGIEFLAEAARKLGLELILVGNLTDPGLLSKLAESCRVKYLGRAPYNIALALEARVPFNIGLYDPSIPLHKLADPNKVYESILLGKPIITNIDFAFKTSCIVNVAYNREEVVRIIDKLINDRNFLKAITRQCSKDSKYIADIVRKACNVFIEKLIKVLEC